MSLNKFLAGLAITGLLCTGCVTVTADGRPIKENGNTTTGKTSQELSQMLKVSRHTLQQYRNKGLIPFTYCQGKVLYKEQDVQELLERNYQPAKWQKE